MPTCSRCEGTGKAYGADRPFESSGPGTYPGPCPVCKGSGQTVIVRAACDMSAAALESGASEEERPMP